MERFVGGRAQGTVKFFFEFQGCCLRRVCPRTGCEATIPSEVKGLGIMVCSRPVEGVWPGCVKHENRVMVAVFSCPWPYLSTGLGLGSVHER